MTREIIVTLNQNDLREIIAEKYKIEKDSIGFEVSTDDFGDSNIYVTFRERCERCDDRINVN